MGRALRLAGGRAGIHDVFAVGAVLRVPAVACPLGVARGIHPDDLFDDRGGRAELLAQLHRIHRAIFDTLPAGDTFVAVYL
ncbi:hypothetical protein SDC9_172104 [bioreactor metagenome]|uniref:Uncharacterized protein n=1 Tax=bioreactor metagenome TaxID=1076179 RepID=A0A645GF99_9ZZZZ